MGTHAYIQVKALRKHAEKKDAELIAQREAEVVMRQKDAEAASGEVDNTLIYFFTLMYKQITSACILIMHARAQAGGASQEKR